MIIANSDKKADPLLSRLRSLARESPYLRDVTELYEEILPLLNNADLHTGKIEMTPEEARRKMENGRVLLDGLELDLDIAALRELMIRLTAAIERTGRYMRPRVLRFPLFMFLPETESAAKRIRTTLEENRMDSGELITSVASGNLDTIISAAKDLELDSALLVVLAQNALKPALRSWSEQLAPLAAGIPWEWGSCYVCGGSPVLGELQDNDQVKHLRCGACGADWRYPRLQCMYCGNNDHNTLGYLYPEGRGEKMRVETCDHCKGYLKVISAFSPTPSDMLTIEDMATLSLDYIAQEKGYTRKTDQLRIR